MQLMGGACVCRGVLELEASWEGGFYCTLLVYFNVLEGIEQPAKNVSQPGKIHCSYCVLGARFPASGTLRGLSQHVPGCC